MLSDYGWQVKTWNLDEKEKRDKWMKRFENQFQYREIFVNNKLAIEFKRKIVM